MNTIQVNFPTDDWVWLCEFLATVLKEGELDPYSREDTQHILDLLNSAEQGVAIKETA